MEEVTAGGGAGCLAGGRARGLNTKERGRCSTATVVEKTKVDAHGGSRGGAGVWEALMQGTQRELWLLMRG